MDETRHVHLITRDRDEIEGTITITWGLPWHETVVYNNMVFRSEHRMVGAVGFYRDDLYVPAVLATKMHRAKEPTPSPTSLPPPEASAVPSDRCPFSHCASGECSCS